MIECPRCEGDGGWDEVFGYDEDEEWDWHECDLCNGTGEVDSKLAKFRIMTTDPRQVQKL